MRLPCHINDVSQFRSQTEKFLISSEAYDLFYEDLGKQVIKETLIGNEPSNVEKLLALIREIASDSKSYLDKLSFFTPILGKLITIILKDAE